MPVEDDGEFGSTEFGIWKGAIFINRHLVEIKNKINFYTEVMNFFCLSPLTLNL